MLRYAVILPHAYYGAMIFHCHAMLYADYAMLSHAAAFTPLLPPACRRH